MGAKMIKNPHEPLKILENHCEHSPDMEAFNSHTFVDMMAAVQAVFNIDAGEIGTLRVADLMKMAFHVFAEHPEYLSIAATVRQRFTSCHPDCSALRVQYYAKSHGLHSVN